jgi:hypothetical protein
MKLFDDPWQFIIGYDVFDESTTGYEISTLDDSITKDGKLLELLTDDVANSILIPAILKQLQ